MSETLTDLFCGAGGSGQGAHVVPGVELVMAANHWPLAIASHQENFPQTDHDCADISQVDPRRYPRTSILWASPECTNHSGAKGRKRAAAQEGLFEAGAPDPGAERSRATMWDVPRFAEFHRYRAVVVENVVEAGTWEMFPAWLHAMACLGYAHRVVWLNSMHAPATAAPRAPQSRDRMYVVFWRAGQRAPQLDVRPLAWCEPCGVEVAAVQSWKRPDRPAWGRYRAQYLYRCPRVQCRNSVVEPYAASAASVIDWSLRGMRIGDRAKALSPKTIARIEAGLARYAHAPMVVPVEGRTGKSASPVVAPLRTQSTRSETALVVPYYGTGVARPTGRELPTMGTVDTAGVAFIAELRGGGSVARHVGRPLATVTASGNHHMLVEAATVRGGQGDTPASTPVVAVPAVADCTFRMLEPAEIQAAMAFTPTYRVLGSRRDQVRQLGNAVTPPAAEFLLRAVVASLSGGAA